LRESFALVESFEDFSTRVRWEHPEAVIFLSLMRESWETLPDEFEDFEGTVEEKFGEIGEPFVQKLTHKYLSLIEQITEKITNEFPEIKEKRITQQSKFEVRFASYLPRLSRFASFEEFASTRLGRGEEPLLPFITQFWTQCVEEGRPAEEWAEAVKGELNQKFAPLIAEWKVSIRNNETLQEFYQSIRYENLNGVSLFLPFIRGEWEECYKDKTVDEAADEIIEELQAKTADLTGKIINEFHDISKKLEAHKKTQHIISSLSTAALFASISIICMGVITAQMGLPELGFSAIGLGSALSLGALFYFASDIKWKTAFRNCRIV
jgi:hypothetical protein